MKKKDFTLIIVVVFISAVVSFFVSAAIFGSPESEPQEAEVVDVITSDFTEPGDKYFNEESVNPTQLIRIGDDEGNISPFGQSN